MILWACCPVSHTSVVLSYSCSVSTITTSSVLTMSQLTDLTHNSMEASMHPEASMAGYGMVN